MRTRWMLAALAASILTHPPTAGAAEDVSADVAELKALVRQLQDQVTAQQDQLEAQQERIDQVDQPSEGSSGLASFLDELELNGWVAGSYWYNFNQPINNAAPGANTAGGFTNPFNPDHNSFALDQLWFELGKPAGEQSRAGFYAELGYGKTAGLLPSGNRGGFDNDLYVLAHIEYLTSLGPKVVAGKFGTFIGAEVAQTVYNFNISRGLVYNLFQPIDHLGAKLEGDLGDTGIDYGIGIVNGFAVDDPDINNAKSLLWHLGWTDPGERLSLGLNGIFGAENPGDGGPKTTVYDVVVGFDPTENISTWLNFDYAEAEVDGAADPSGWGLALAGRLALNDRAGISTRFEYVEEEDGFLGLGPGGEGDAISVTGSFDYALTEKLKARAELRYDTVRIDGAADDFFIGDERLSGTSTPVFDEGDQIVGGVELVYTF